jgi:hypothetical protein
MADSQNVVVDIAREGKLLPPKAGVCQCCAVDHPEHYPHDQTSIYFQYWFYNRSGRWPTWHDAARHCDSELRAEWFRLLGEDGIEIGPDPEANRG